MRGRLVLSTPASTVLGPGLTAFLGNSRPFAPYPGLMWLSTPDAPAVGLPAHIQTFLLGWGLVAA
ncbi:MAG TPA: hypothetical protein VGE81_08015 [Candidatus Limnocylindrales bacterium]